MLQTLLQFLQNIIVEGVGSTGYAGVFVMMLLESCGILLPSEIIMPFAGFLVAKGSMNFWIAVLSGTFGNLAGSLLAYWIGMKGGRPLIEKWGRYISISKHDLDIADRWFQKRGEAIVFFGRLLPVIRTYISFPAGIARMEIHKFSLYTFLGALPWSMLFTWLGMKLQEHWDELHEQLRGFDYAAVALIAAGLGWYVVRHVRR